ncbi:hypothetical protein DPMN_085692 [Dreissena polymorpha]|uniref:Uncharacterized protein n=1 Tax=Dreissena polymorpha TaxID=45954 RepID=A0A9D3YCU0_DREPO|nr:hypothetical protein DPMN_085692 [Dreissena polymorpha]
MGSQHAEVRPLNTSAFKDCSVSPMAHKTNAYVPNTCWPTRVSFGDRQTTKYGLVWTRDQALLSLHNCVPEQRQQDGKYQIVDVQPRE